MKIKKSRGSTRSWLMVLALLLAIIAMALIWRWTPLHETLTADRIAQNLESIENSAWAPLIFIGAFVVGGLILFPVTVLSAATAITFAPLKAAPISFAGIMLSAALMHWVGARFLKSPGHRLFGTTIRRIDGVIGDKSVLAVASLRMMPVAPFTLVNLAAGAVGIRFSDYMLGSALGLAPGLTMMCLFGRQVRAFWKDPSASAVIIAGGVVMAWIAMSLALQRWLSSVNARSSVR